MISPVGRLILPEPGEAAWNMSLDQAIMESVDEAATTGRDAVPTLRFYTWSRPSLSLGYFQSQSLIEPRHKPNEHLQVVRRSTGGGAIMHHHELTYSITVPVPAGDSGARLELYSGIHAAIAETLSDHGVVAKPYREDGRLAGVESAFLCFQRRTDEDLIVSGYKILGSAQRRSKRAVLQHGSLLLRASEHANELPGIWELTSKLIDAADLSERLSESIGQRWGTRFEPGLPTEPEKTRADQILTQRFGNSQWMSRR